MKHNFNIAKFVNLLILLILFVLSSTAYSQYAIKWMSAGSLHNWYSEIGSEIEEGNVKQQQYGMQWPALYLNQDIQAAKGFWIGSKNFTDASGTYPHRVVHIGPRVSGAGEFIPLNFEMTSKFDPPQVYVDKSESYDKNISNDFVDPDLFADRMIENKTNTLLGITMTRRIFQFSQEYHDNYIVSEYIFKNTGNTDADTVIELPGNTLNDVIFYYQYRLAVCANTRYEIGNGTGWGMNTMNDARGDGVKIDPDNPDNLRFQYVWHGKFPPFTGGYDNIGGPIWIAATNVAAGDTVGRLGAYQFAGVLTLHADVSATDKNDDPLQPKTTSWEGSDDPLTSGNDAFNKTKMTDEYGWMSKGHRSPRHADQVEPSGLPGFLSPSGDPALGTPGGHSFCNGYGPYTLAPGDSVRIVFAEVVSGISRELATTAGIQYKRSARTPADALIKNQIVFQGRDSLFHSIRRAMANFQSGYDIPEAPLPPKVFNVNGLSDKISLTWETYSDPGPAIEGFEIYRAVGKYDSTYYLIHTATTTERSYEDYTAIRGLPYYYYIVSVGSESENTGVGLTPAGKLRSSRYYTQTYNEATLKRPPNDWPIPAKVIGTKPGKFGITAGVNDKLQIAIDGADPIVVTLVGDSLSTNQVASQINLAFNLNVAANELNYLRIYSPSKEEDSKVDIQPISNDAYATLGLVVGETYRVIPDDPMGRIRIVPNPYNISASKELGFGDQQANRLAFYDLPGRCTIKIYSELGELINTIEHTDGTGDEFWDSVTSSNQIVVSGIYIAVFENLDTGEKKILKFVIIR